MPRRFRETIPSAAASRPRQCGCWPIRSGSPRYCATCSATLPNFLRQALRIELRATIDGKRVLVEVTGRGVGVHPDDVSRIFEKLGRGRDQGGAPVPWRSGSIGSAHCVAYGLVRAHGGQIHWPCRPARGRGVRKRPKPAFGQLKENFERSFI